MKELLFVVDMVNGFVKEGSMHDLKIMNIVDSIKEECESHEHRIFIADTHENDAIEFNSFPSHCVKGTSEAEIIDELKPYERISRKIVEMVRDINALRWISLGDVSRIFRRSRFA